MNFDSFTYQENQGETPANVPWLKMLFASVYCSNIKTTTIESPVIELIDLKITKNELDIGVLDNTVVSLQNQITLIKDRLDRLTGNFEIPFCIEP